LLLHEKYLKGCDHDSTIVALLTFLEDAGLANFVSIIEAEKFRQLALKGKTNSTLNQEDFYDWLRYVADFVYEDGKDRRKALHNLLIHHIIPLARNEMLCPPRSSKWLVLSDLLKPVMKYIDFVVLWYSSLTSFNTVRCGS
jgi:hypothetical protein